MIVEKYITEHKLIWAETTQRDERYRLLKVLPHLDGNPRALLEHLRASNLGKYTQKTVWIRVTHFYDWLVAQKMEATNAYREFKRQHPRLFQNAYVRTSPAVSFRQARDTIRQLPDLAARRKALELLASGCRFDESFTYRDGFVTGKGDKRRAVYMPQVEGPEYTKSYHSFRKALKAVGLKPHDLRKIWAREMSKSMSAWALCEAGGWESIETTRSYINTEHDTIERVRRAAVGI